MVLNIKLIKVRNKEKFYISYNKERIIRRHRTYQALVTELIRRIYEVPDNVFIAVET